MSGEKDRETDRLGFLPVGVMKDYRAGELAHLQVFSQQEIRQAQMDALEDAARTAEIPVAGPVTLDIIAGRIRRLKEKV